MSVHLTFGLHYHAALERYDHAKAAGADHESATLLAVQYALDATWDSRLGRPWTSDDRYKNRETLIRSIVWYLDEFTTDPFTTIALANGKPAVELSFRFESSHFDPTGQPYLLCGHLDRVASFNDQLWVIDRKTTKGTLDGRFFDNFTPDNQFTLYTLAGRVVLGQPIRGIVVDGAQIAVTFSRFGRGLVERPAPVVDEWYQDLRYWLDQAEACAKAQSWPQNDKTCGLYGGCAYRGICSKSPSTRLQWLRSDFAYAVWDPLLARGDI